MQEQPNQPSMLDDMRGGGNILMFIIESYAMFAEVLLHFRFGSRYFGLRALGVIGLILFHESRWHGSGTLDMAVCLVGFMVLWLGHRLHMGVRFCQGTLDQEHSRYDGFPWLMLLSRTNDDERGTKMWAEPIILIFAAVLMDPMATALGSWLCLCGVCQFLANAAHHVAERQRMLDVRDQVMTMQQQHQRRRPFGR